MLAELGKCGTGMCELLATSKSFLFLLNIPSLSRSKMQLGKGVFSRRVYHMHLFVVLFYKSRFSHLMCVGSKVHLCYFHQM